MFIFTQVCAKVFASKRKVFNVAAARVAGTEAAKFFDPKKGQPKGGGAAQVRCTKIRSGQAGFKVFVLHVLAHAYTRCKWALCGLCII